MYVSTRFDVSHVDVPLTLMINADDTWECSVYHVTINTNSCTALDDAPKVLNDEKFQTREAVLGMMILKILSRID